MSNPQIGTPPTPSAEPTPIDSGRGEAIRPVRETGSGEEGSRRAGLPVWLFVLIVVLFAVALGWQFQVAGQLEQKISGLEQELNEANALLGAHQSRLSEIRTGVHDLAGRLEGLKALVDANPEASLETDLDRSTGSQRLDDSAKARPRIPARLPQ